MRKFSITSIIVVIGLFSCGQENKSTQKQITANIETLEFIKTSENQKPQNDDYKRFIDTEYQYTDVSGKSLMVQNSLPKGGLEYIDSDGIRYVYAIFWTRIINETDHPIELSIEVPTTSFERLDSPGNYFKIFVPKNKVNFDQVSSLNFGLGELHNMIYDKLEKAPSFPRTISPKNTSSFYVVTLFTKGLDGPVRAGLSVKEDNLFYQLNQNKMHIGQINLENMTLTEQ